MNIMYIDEHLRNEILGLNNKNEEEYHVNTEDNDSLAIDKNH
jgi:hypothetical protein